MGQSLGNVAIGSTVYLKENNTRQAYLVVNQGKPSDIYDESCNGTWLLRQDLIERRVWDDGDVNKLESSDIQAWLNSTMLGKYDSNIQAAIKQVKIPYRKNGGSGGTDQTGANGLSCKVFLLSGYEVGWTTSTSSYFPVDGAKLSYFEAGTGSSANNKRIAKLNGSTLYWWLRSPFTDYADVVWRVYSNGDYGYYSANVSCGVRPAMVMPTDLLVDDSNNIIIPTVSTLTAPSVVMQGQSIPLSWSPVSVSGFDVNYQLQRNADNGGWTTIYTGADTSYTDTAGIWTQVQYQVAAVVKGAVGNYTQSSIIPVSSPQTLVISGSDGNLGTLTSNVPYTVSSNTGKPISLTRTVNGAQVVTLTVDSGFAYNIPIADLPTGTGTIQITASVESSSETVTQTRTWTYYKTPINIPSIGGIAQLTQNGQNIWPVTVPDAVEAPVYLGGNLNAALNKLGQAALYTKIGTPKYNQVTVDLSKVKVGDEVLLPYNDVMVSHIVVHIGNPDDSMYDASCNGVWLLRKDCIATGQWNTNNKSTLSGSTIMTNMANYVAQYNDEVSSSIKQVKIPYIISGSSGTVNKLGQGLSCKMFPLSIREVKGSSEKQDGVVLDYFNITNSNELKQKRIALLDDSPSGWWARTADTYGGSTDSYYIDSTGNDMGESCSKKFGYRPCFIMPTTFNQTYYVDSSNNIYPSQEYTQGGSITDVFGYDVPICQYEVGSYVGTGTYGSSSLSSLTFSFEPKFIMISPEMPWGPNSFFKYGFPWIKGMTQGISYIVTNNMTSTDVVNISWTNNGVSWNGTNAVIQLNKSGTKYHYVAIG